MGERRKRMGDDLLPASRRSSLLDESDQVIAIIVTSVTAAKPRKQES